MEDFLDQLIRRAREAGANARVDPRMLAADTDATYVTFIGPVEDDGADEENADSPGPNAPGSSQPPRC